MTIYVVPANGHAKEISDAAARASIPFFQASTVREYILGCDGKTIAVVAVPEEVMLVLARHANQIFTELPSVVTSVPGLMYDQSWMAMGTIFPPTHWKTFEEQMKRSGVLSTSPDMASSRNVGANVASLSAPDDADTDEADAIG